jgi:hypothetical protein
VELFDGTARVPGCELEVRLDTLSKEPDEIDQMKKDEIFDLGNRRSKVRLALQWIYSRVKLLEDILQMLSKQIEEDRLSLLQAQENYDTMNEPFKAIFQANL